MSDNEIKLKACPFCGSKSAYLHADQKHETDWYSIVCPFCDSTTAEYVYPAHAIEAWNERNRPYPNNIMKRFRRAQGLQLLLGLAFGIFLSWTFHRVFFTPWPLDDKPECADSALQE
jgi:Lar family restriction alleviation protein